MGMRVSEAPVFLGSKREPSVWKALVEYWLNNNPDAAAFCGLVWVKEKQHRPLVPIANLLFRSDLRPEICPKLDELTWRRDRGYVDLCLCVISAFLDYGTVEHLRLSFTEWRDVYWRLWHMTALYNARVKKHVSREVGNGSAMQVTKFVNRRLPRWITQIREGPHSPYYDI